MRFTGILVFMLIAIFGQSQITIENMTFPQVGDTLKYFLENMPEDLEATTSGPDQQWDISFLNSQVQFQQIIFPVSSSDVASSFPNADYYIVSDASVDLLGVPLSGERFMQVFNNRIDEIGFYSNTDFGFDFLQMFDGNNIFRRAPMSYNDVFDASFNLSIPISTELLPDTITGQFPILPDSIRIRFEIERSEIVDAWGTMTIPTGDFDVLRLNRTDVASPFLDVLLAPGVWQEIDPGLLGGLGGIFMEQTVKSHLFYSDKSKEEIAVFTLNEGDTITSIQYKANNIKTNSILIQPGKQDVIAYPNPTFGEIKFDLLNFTPGKYRLEIHNIIGKRLWSNSYYLNQSNDTIKENLSFLKKGTYLYSIIDSQGKKISTKRLIIITP